MIVKLFKDGKVVTEAAFKTLEAAFENGIELDKILYALSCGSKDPIQKLLIKELCKLKGINLCKPEETGGDVA